MVEPALLGWSGAALALRAALVGGGFLLAAGLFGPLRPRAVDDYLAARIGAPDHSAGPAQYGLLGSLVLHAIRWQRGPVAVPKRPPLRAGPRAPEIVVAIQIESFVDPATLATAGPPLPNLERIRAGAGFAGFVDPPCRGAYTQRPEFEVLTGVATDHLGFDRFDPYVRGEAFADSALPRRFAAAGYDTVFLHPHDRRFFRRDRVMPAFGFSRMIDDGEFSDADRCGPYIGDVATGRRIIAEVANATRPLFLFAVTMENHGPWSRDRIEKLAPDEQFAAHLVNADRMIGEIMDALERDPRRSLFVFYGDHTPIATGDAIRCESNLTPFAVLTKPGRGKRRLEHEAVRPVQLHDWIVELFEEP
jgi:hypothetical protein